MTSNQTTQAIADHFRRALAMLRDAVLAFPPEAWREGDSDYQRPAGVVYHMLEAIDFYFGDQPGDHFPWGARFGVDWEDPRSELLPDQEGVSAYLAEMQAKLANWFEHTDLSAPEKTFPWTGATALARVLYVLRHTQHHVAELNLELIRRGIKGPDWQ